MLVGLLRALTAPHELALENLALRQQLAVLRRQVARPRLRRSDRLFWLLLARWWPRWRSQLHLVQPSTVIEWHRAGFRLFWNWRSRGGRPAVDVELRALIRRLAHDNPRWGAEDLFFDRFEVAEDPDDNDGLQ